jgi:Protein of unknown function (DUF559)
MKHDKLRAPGSARRKMLALAGGNHGVVGRAQLMAEGVTTRELDCLIERGEIEPVWPGVYVPSGAPTTLRQRLLGACVWVMGHASHRSAAHLLELPGGSGSIVEVSTSRSIKSRAAVLHRRPPLPQCDLTEVGGVPVTAAHRTVLDLGAVQPEKVVEMAIDDALRRELITLPQLRWHLALAGKRGVRGTAKLRRILDARSELKGERHSPLETLAARLFGRSQLPWPALQMPVYRGDEFLGRCDFAYPDLKIAIEVLGWKWHYGKRQWEQDLRRRTHLVAAGWIVLEFTWDDVTKRPDYVTDTVLDAIKQRSFLRGAPTRWSKEKRTG